MSVLISHAELSAIQEPAVHIQLLSLLLVENAATAAQQD
jgi:hypothetical protein